MFEEVALVWCCGESNLVALAVVSAASNCAVFARGANKQVGVSVVEVASDNLVVHLHNNILEPVGAYIQTIGICKVYLNANVIGSGLANGSAPSNVLPLAVRQSVFLVMSSPESAFVDKLGVLNDISRVVI